MKKGFALKIAVAGAMISAIIVLAGSQLYPNVSKLKILITAALAIFAMVLIALLHALVVGRIREILLKNGAIDTIWLWFPDYPEGFKRIWRAGSKKNEKQ